MKKVTVSQSQLNTSIMLVCFGYTLYVGNIDNVCGIRQKWYYNNFVLFFPYDYEK